MRFSARQPLLVMSGLLLAAYACNIQPGDSGPPASGTTGPLLAPEPAAPARQAAEPAQAERVPLRPQPIAPTPAVEAPTGPMATEAAPLPKADQRIAIFHSSNVEGELDPCG